MLLPLILYAGLPVQQSSSNLLLRSATRMYRKVDTVFISYNKHMHVGMYSTFPG